MTDTPAGPPNRQLPPASTTKQSFVAAGAAAVRFGRARVHEGARGGARAPAHEELDLEVQEALRAAQAAQGSRERRVEREDSDEPQTFTLAQLVERVQQGWATRRQAVESGDPDGPDIAGWDPGGADRSALDESPRSRGEIPPRRMSNVNLAAAALGAIHRKQGL